jgi:hypothetical protein
MMRTSWLLLAGLAALGCSTPGYVKTAYYGDLATLKKEIGDAKARHALDRSSVVELARAVARREVRSTPSGGGDDVIDRIRATRTCVRSVEPELRERAAIEDDAGAEALLVLADSGRIAPVSLVDRYAHAPQGALRAVAARGTFLPRDERLRRAFYVDGDERVRRNAFRAAFEAKDAAEVELLLEAARLDPSPANRGLAVRAAGNAGGARAVLGLRDVWTTADPAVRLAIVEAWGMPRVASLGGVRELVEVAEKRDSLASVAAGSQLMRVGGEGASIGRAVVFGAVNEGTTDERMLAIQLVPLSDPEGLAVVERAAKEPRGAARIVAWARLLDSPAHRKDALAQLTDAARGKDAASRQAVAALAASEDASVTNLLLGELDGKDPAQRERAALGLFRLGRAPDMAGTLADPDPDVRLSVACSVLALDADPHAG